MQDKNKDLNLSENNLSETNLLEKTSENNLSLNSEEDFDISQYSNPNNEIDIINNKQAIVLFDFFIRIILAILSTQLLNIILFEKTLSFSLIATVSAFQIILSHSIKLIHQRINSKKRIIFLLTILLVLTTFLTILFDSEFIFLLTLLVIFIPVLINLIGLVINKIIISLVKYEKKGILLKHTSQIGLLITAITLVLIGFIFDSFPLVYSIEKTNIFDTISSLNPARFSFGFCSFVILIYIIMFSIKLPKKLMNEIISKKEKNNQKQQDSKNHFKQIFNFPKNSVVFIFSFFYALIISLFAIFGPYLFTQLYTTGLGYTLTTFVLAMMIVAPIFSPLVTYMNASRYGPNISMLIGNILFLTLPLSLTFVGNQISIWLIVAFLSVLGSSIAYSSYELFIRDNYKRKDHSRYIYSTESLTSFFSFILLIIFSMMLKYFEITVIFNTITILSIIVVLMLFFCLFFQKRIETLIEEI